MKKMWLLVVLMFCFALPCAIAEEAPTKYTSGCYKYILLEDGTAEITGYVGDTKLLAKLELPSQLDGHPVTSLGDYSLAACSKLRIVTLPDSLVTMGKNPFAYCKELREIKVAPDHPAFATIDGVLFHKGDKKLICYPHSFTDTEYAVPKGILSIGDSAFLNCGSLTSITLPDTVTTIESSAFDTCHNMTSIRLSKGLTTIGDRALYNCLSLTYISLPDSLVTMGSNPFERCTKLVDIIVSPDHPVFAMIDDVLFHKADKKLICYPCVSTAAEYTVPEGILTIGDHAFTFCTKLERITLPDTVTTIGQSAFSECGRLASIIIPQSVTSIGDSAFSSCDELISITLPGSITRIGDDTFNSCEGLASIIIPDRVTSIGERAFARCSSLTNVTLPDSVTSIGMNAFFNCGSLKTITVPYDSYAEQYCKGNKLPVAYPDAADWLSDDSSDANDWLLN